MWDLLKRMWRSIICENMSIIRGPDYSCDMFLSLAPHLPCQKGPILQQSDLALVACLAVACDNLLTRTQ